MVQDARSYLSVRLATGLLEIDGLSFRPVSDRQVDALRNYIEGGGQP